MQGLWWTPGAADSRMAAAAAPGSTSQLVAEAAAGAEGARLLQLAAAQRLSTDAQRAAFCCIMGATDPAQATERLLRLPLKVARRWVPLECMPLATLSMLAHESSAAAACGSALGIASVL